MHACVHCSAIHYSQDMEAGQGPVSRRVDETDVGTHTRGQSPAIKKREIWPYVWNLRNKANK